MQRFFREFNIRRYPKWVQILIMLLIWSIFSIVGSSLAEFVLKISAWSEYQQAKSDARTFRSTQCRIEDIINEVTPSNHNKTVQMTSVKAFFLLRVVNSTNKQDQFRLEEVPLVLKADQHSLVNSSLACFYDPSGVKQARLSLLNLSEAKLEFKRWCVSTVIVAIASLFFISYYALKLFRKIHQLIKARYQVTAPIEMQPINFV